MSISNLHSKDAESLKSETSNNSDVHGLLKDGRYRKGDKLQSSCNTIVYKGIYSKFNKELLIFLNIFILVI